MDMMSFNPIWFFVGGVIGMTIGGIGAVATVSLLKGRGRD